jgi:hypothetical protein
LIIKDLGKLNKLIVGIMHFVPDAEGKAFQIVEEGKNQTLLIELHEFCLVDAGTAIERLLNSQHKYAHEKKVTLAICYYQHGLL